MTTADWLPEQCNRHGQCHYCGRDTHLRIEPFGRQPACRACWEQICYGENE
jgi:hypothetical protein